MMIGKVRNFGLDVVRTISILLVVLAHRFDIKYEIGALGVQIFFILSGFLIGQILLKDFKDSGHISIVFNFWKRRWFRTLPLYYLVLLFKILVYGNPFGWKMIVYFLFLQANFVGISFFGISWSLVIEEWFYIFLPLTTLFFFRQGINVKKYIYFLLGFIILFFTARFAWNYFHKGIIIYQFDCLLLGVSLALIKQNYQTLYERLNSVYVFLIGFSGVVFFTWIYGKVQYIPIYDTFYRVTWFLLISIFITIIIPFVEQSYFINYSLKKIKPLFYFFTWTSILTYSIYLLHMEVFHIPILLLNDAITFVIQMTTLYISCYLIYSLFENPVMQLRDNFSFKQYIKSFKLFPLDFKRN
jgi:peptidoglycan/LPS O-acetylase OafA/YrhL